MMEFERIIAEHRDKLIFCVAAHDHIGSLRSYHDDDGWIVGLSLNPSLTPRDVTQPAIAYMEVDDTNYDVSLMWHFIELNTTYTYDMDKVIDVFENFEDLAVNEIARWHTVDFGIVTPESIYTMVRDTDNPIEMMLAFTGNYYDDRWKEMISKIFFKDPNPASNPLRYPEQF
jgi:hypothetical protein